MLSAALAALMLASCSSKRDVLPPPDPEPSAQQASAPNEPAQGGFMPGGKQTSSKFKTPTDVAKGTPDINTVPTTAPKASSKEERAKALAGLVADCNNAHYADQGGRTQPVAVRPLVDTPAGAESAVA